MNDTAAVEPLVSCIMPTANRARFVPQAIACFLAQDFTGRELVVLDGWDARDPSRKAAR